MRIGNIEIDNPVALGPMAQLCRTIYYPWPAARQAPLSYTISLSLIKLMSIGLVMLSNHLTLCRPLLLLPSIFLHQCPFQ